MKLPDGTILMHGAIPYNPAKAHEYYLRTRELKGRKKGSTYQVKGRGGKTQTLTEKQLAEQKVNAAKRVGEIKQRLHKLTSELQKRMADARDAEAKSKRGPTAADKSKAAREAKKYRDKNKQKLSNKRNKGGGSKKTGTPGSRTDSVDDLKQKVDRVRDILKSAVARQRSLSSATKNG